MVNECAVNLIFSSPFQNKIIDTVTIIQNHHGPFGN